LNDIAGCGLGTPVADVLPKYHLSFINPFFNHKLVLASWEAADSLNYFSLRIIKIMHVERRRNECSI
jgi:hypothetical protein